MNAAISAMRVVRLDEKGRGKRHADAPPFEAFLDKYIEAAEKVDRGKSPLLRPARG